MIPTAKTKRCPKCQTIKPINEFYERARAYDGLQSECKQCQLDRRRDPNASIRPKATFTQKSQKPLRNDTLGTPEDEPKNPRYSSVRNTSRRTGQCSWGILDNHRYDAFPVVHIADNLKDALIECERLNAPPEKIKYTKRGQIGFVTNEDVEDDA